VNLRPAHPSDCQAVDDLTRRAYGQYEALIGRPPVPMTEDYAPRIAEGEVWLLEDADELIGLLVLEDRGDRSQIFSVVVSPERQGAGLGRDLLRFAEQTARERGHHRLALYTNARMERNIRIYSSFGYRETGREPHPKLPGSTVVNMEKELE
jgi:GNAT superfamily N-acetyltransferase